jgi:hypothetical protein
MQGLVQVAVVLDYGVETSARSPREEGVQDTDVCPQCHRDQKNQVMTEQKCDLDGFSTRSLCVDTS